MLISGRNSDLDFEVAKVVFSIDPETYRWGVPSFSTDRSAAAIVNTEMAFRKDGTRERYDKELEKIAIKSCKGGMEYKNMSMLLVLLLPDEICKAAIMACRKNDP